MPSLTTGRPLDDDGRPIHGHALQLDTDGHAAELLTESPHALASGPGSGTWSVLLDDYSDDRPEMVVWLAPDAAELPPHVHRTSEETFEALTGELTVVVEDEAHRLTAGDSRTVEPGAAHFFRNDTDDFVAFRVEPPWAKTVQTQYTFFGCDHEGKFGADGEYGEPGPLHALVLSEAVSDETRIDIAPHRLQRAAWATLGRLAKRLGHRAIEDVYLTDEFWRDHVEQPNV